MSARAQAWALLRSVGSSSAKHLLSCLANYADERGHCAPSIADVVADTELSKAAVIRAAALLERRNLLTVDRRDRVPIGYQLKLNDYAPPRRKSVETDPGHILQFSAACVEEDPSGPGVSATRIYRAYVAWCTSNRLRAASQALFGRVFQREWLRLDGRERSYQCRLAAGVGSGAAE